MKCIQRRISRRPAATIWRWPRARPQVSDACWLRARFTNRKSALWMIFLHSVGIIVIWCHCTVRRNPLALSALVSRRTKTEPHRHVNILSARWRHRGMCFMCSHDDWKPVAATTWSGEKRRGNKVEQQPVKATPTIPKSAFAELNSFFNASDTWNENVFVIGSPFPLAARLVTTRSAESMFD